MSNILTEDMLAEEYVDKIIKMVDEHILEAASNGVYFFESENMMEELQNDIKNFVMTESETDEYSEEIAEDVVLFTSIANDYMSELKEACEKNEDDDEDDDEDSSDDEKDKEHSDDDDEDDEDPCDEAVATKHKISRIQSMLDKRKRKTDAAYKHSRKLTLMRQKARGGRIINRKISKGVKKTLRKGFGKRWEDGTSEEPKVFEDYDKMPASKKKYGHISDADHEEGDVNPDDHEVTPDNDKDKKQLRKCMHHCAEVRKEAVKESLEESFKDIQAFGTLNESDSNELKEAFIDAVVNGINENSKILSEELITEAQNYINEEVIPQLQEDVEGYIADEVIPSLNEDIEQYLDYMAEEMATDMKNQTMIVKSPKTAQYEAFEEKLLGLIKESLQIIPEQEDALVVSESKNEALKNKLDAAITEKVKAKMELKEAEKAIWVQSVTPKNLSEAGIESLYDKISDINESDMNRFKTEVMKIINESSDTSDDQTTTNTKSVNESTIESNNTNFDFIKRAAALV